jgi:hypothetical protein
MKKLDLQFTPGQAARVLKALEAELQAERSTIVAATQRAKDLEDSITTIKGYLHESGDFNGEISRRRGTNKQLIVDFLKTVPAARAIDIYKATGIPKSSVPFTLRQHPGAFEYDAENAVWKLKQ